MGKLWVPVGSDGARGRYGWVLIFEQCCFLGY